MVTSEMWNWVIKVSLLACVYYRNNIIRFGVLIRSRIKPSRNFIYQRTTRGHPFFNISHFQLKTAPELPNYLELHTYRNHVEAKAKRKAGKLHCLCYPLNALYPIMDMIIVGLNYLSFCGTRNTRCSNGFGGCSITKYLLVDVQLS